MWDHRLKDWKTMPSSERMWSTCFWLAGFVLPFLWIIRICSPSTQISPSVAVFKQVDAAQESGLAGARRSEQRNHVAILGIERDAAQHLMGAEALADIADRKSGNAGHGSSNHVQSGSGLQRRRNGAAMSGQPIFQQGHAPAE